MFLIKFILGLFHRQKYWSINSHQIKTLEHNKNTIEYCCVGEGEPLILIMGYAGTMQAWDYRFLNYLSQTNKIIIFNNRNTGRSHYVQKIFSMADLASDIEILRRELKLAKISVLGISMGGMIAQQYGWTYPDVVNKIILIRDGEFNNIPIEAFAVLPCHIISKTPTSSEGNVKIFFFRKG